MDLKLSSAKPVSMGAYECEPCGGSGKIKCDTCRCKTCGATGKVSGDCISCDNGMVVCSRCEGGGRVVVKQGWFSDTYGECSACGGSGQRRCSICNGTGTRLNSCSACHGKGRNSNCSQCSGTARFPCTKCGGSGRDKTEWLRAPNAASVDQLRFEYDKRHHRARSLQLEISRLTIELEHDYEEDRLDRLENPSKYYGDGSEVIFSNEGAIKRVQRQIQDIEEELEAIEMLLRAKWH
jgi:hypothetical protein